MSLLEDLLVEEDLLVGDPIRLDDDDDNDDGNNAEIHEENEAANDDDNAEETENKKRVTPKKRIKNPQVRLNPDRLRGPRGLSTVESYFKDIKFQGKGHEKEDLDKVMWRLQHWCHRLYPKFQFDECLKKIEKLGSKRVVQTYVNKIRNGLLDNENQEPTVINTEEVMNVLPLEDEFDEIMNDELPVTQQTTQNESEIITDEMKERMLRNKELAKQKLIAKRLAEEQQLLEYENSDNLLASQDANNSVVVQDVADASQQFGAVSEITEEQKERMERQRQLAIQKRLERLKKQQEEKMRDELLDLNDTVNSTTDLNQTDPNL